MRRLTVFESVSVDGFYAATDGDMRWFHTPDPDGEQAAFAGDNASGDGELWFGRLTYEIMAAFWPTPAAAQAMPKVAAGMTARTKRVFTRTLQTPGWANVVLERGDVVTRVRELKADGDTPVTILGSGRLVAPLAAAGLVDEYQLVIVPVALGAGRSLFAALPAPLRLVRTRTRAFGNGNTFVAYEPAK